MKALIAAWRAAEDAEERACEAINVASGQAMSGDPDQLDLFETGPSPDELAADLNAASEERFTAFLRLIRHAIRTGERLPDRAAVDWCEMISGLTEEEVRALLEGR